MTLDQALQECARNTYNTKIMVRTNDTYSSKGLLYAQRFTSGINYALRKVARERVAPLAKETITLDDRGMYDLDGLSNSCLRVNRIVYDQDQEVAFRMFGTNITVNGYEGADMEISYEYLPEDMDLDTDLDIELRIDSKNVDALTLCQYADYQFLSEEGTEYDSARAQVWLGLFTDSFNEIERTMTRPRRVRYNG